MVIPKSLSQSIERGLGFGFNISRKMKIVPAAWLTNRNSPIQSARKSQTQTAEIPREARQVWVLIAQMSVRQDKTVV